MSDAKCCSISNASKFPIVCLMLDFAPSCTSKLEKYEIKIHFH